ncbi:MAG: hypothetical protein O2913_00330 [Chloroflexi bacterium]|nr:hypothetical protein [Chloroflexota bacterium]
MKFSKLYAIAALSGIIGAVAGAFGGGIIAASRCDGGLECLGIAFLGVGLGAILVESCALSLSAHIGNQGRGNLLLTFVPTVILAVPIPILLLPGFTAVLAIPLFLFQTWVCVKVQLATTGKRRVRRKT